MAAACKATRSCAAMSVFPFSARPILLWSKCALTGRCESAFRLSELVVGRYTLPDSSCDSGEASATTSPHVMAAIGRFQKGDDIFYAKVVDGAVFRLRGDVFGSPSFDKKATPI